MPIPQETKKKLGYVSYVLFISQLACGAFVAFIALSDGGGGHPPGGIMLLIFLGYGVKLLAPIGVLLGALGNPTMIGKSIIGLVGNSVLSLLVFWFTRHV
jgi:hypothetical protein